MSYSKLIMTLMIILCIILYAGALTSLPKTHIECNNRNCLYHKSGRCTRDFIRVSPERKCRDAKKLMEEVNRC